MKTPEEIQRKISISNFAKQFAIPVKLATQAWTEGGDSYNGAYEWLLSYLKATYPESFVK
jgi:hypothetical protein